jgi:3-hydroxyisobutyrate dehydrogenase-like beta-hydroxyacid dehydrogenase
MVGAGRMGRPMARRLVEAGHDVRVLGRSAATRTALEADGLRAVAGIADVAAEVVVVCVFTDEQVREVCLDGDLLTHLPRGATVVVHTTGNPRTVETIAEHAAPHGIGVVDAPVSGGPHDIAAGRITLFTGGADEDVQRVRPVLDTYGDPVLHVGPLGSGQRVKLVNNALFAAQVGLVAEAIRLGTELGVAEAVLLDALPHGSAASRALTGVAGRGSVAAFARTVGDFVGKDVAVARTVAAELGSALGALDVASF